MKFRRILVFMIAIIAAGQPVFSFPLQSSLTEASWMELSVKARLGGLNYYGNFILNGSLSSGIKGFVPVFKNRNGKPFYVDADIPASG